MLEDGSMVKQLSEHRQKTDLYLKILNKALEVGDNQLACIVRNKIKHHNHQEYSIATPTGGVLIRFPNSKPPESAQPSDEPPLGTGKVWLDWAIGLSVFPGSLLAMVGLVLGFS
jgi:hypothetical protein